MGSLADSSLAVSSAPSLVRPPLTPAATLYLSLLNQTLLYHTAFCISELLAHQADQLDDDSQHLVPRADNFQPLDATPHSM